MSESALSPAWKRRSLLSLADYHNGAAFNPSHWGEEGLPIIRIEQINNPSAPTDFYKGPLAPQNAVTTGDLIFSWSATLKAVIWRNGDGVLNQHLFKVVPKNGTDKAFLKYVLEQNMENISSGSQGSTMKHITRGELQRYHVEVPKQEAEQRRIAEILSTLDEAIEQTEALLAKHQEIKAGLMHDLFTRGVTSDGHLRPTRDQAPDLYKESPLGWIPKEWEVVSIADAFEIQLGKMLNKLAKTGKCTAPYLGNRAVQWDFVDCMAIEEMDFTPTERQKFSLERGDLLVCEGGDVGRTAMWRGEIGGCYYQKAIHRLRPKSERALPAFMLRFMRYARESGYFREFTSQSSIAHLTQEKLGVMPMLLPKSEEQNRIAERFDAYDELIQNEQTKLTKLRQQKHSLMCDLLTGKVCVRIHGQENTI
ncbi:MAG: restriction endonuclease subunit S [Pseudomonadota bacterium]|mgnify:CR=1 FL=1